MKEQIPDSGDAFDEWAHRIIKESTMERLDRARRGCRRAIDAFERSLHGLSLSRQEEIRGAATVMVEMWLIFAAAQISPGQQAQMERRLKDLHESTFGMEWPG
jgi:hypothetical protein